MQLIFEEFEQQSGQDVSRYGGTGLGLAICRRLVEAMGGSISVESKIGEGSTFTVSLNDVDVAAFDIYEQRDPELFDLDSVDFMPATLLVVDDHSYNRDLLKGFFQKYGLKILEAENGQVALDMIREFRPDLVLLDIKMPVMDGYELSRLLKDDPELKTIPIIVVTASALQEDEKNLRRICEGYLRKPVNRVELIKMAMKFLDHTMKTDVEPALQQPAALNRQQASERLGFLTDDLLDNLRLALRLGDVGKLNEIIDDVAQTDSSLADYLRNKVKEFSFDEISVLLPESG